MATKTKIAVNTRFLLENKLEGIGNYTFEVLKRLVKLMPEVEFHFLFDRPFAKQFVLAENVVPHVLFPQARHPLLWYWWFEISVKQWLNQHKPNLFFSPDGYLSLNTNTPTVLTMHDIAFEHFPKHIPFLTRKYYQHYSPKFAKRAQQIITVSNFSKTDIVKQYGTNSEKIAVIHNGIAKAFMPVSNQQKQATKQAYTNGESYFLTVGSINPRKNLGTLIRAFDAYKQNGGNKKLVITGAKGWRTNAITQTLNNARFKTDIILTGYLNKATLAQVMGSAFAFIYPSIFEGFGLPILEAMQSHVPVIASNIAIFNEIGNDAFLPFNPQSETNLANKMLELETNEPLRLNLIEKGKKQAQNFSWNNSAEAHKAVLEQLIK